MRKDESFPPSLFSEDDCDRPACADTVSALKGILGKTPPTASSSPMSKGLQQQTTTTTTTFIQCPPTSSLLGNSSWDLLHSMAAWYPDQPDIQHETQMKNFIDALATFYPCTYCAQDFQENIITNPVRTKSRKELSQWMCEQHNVVNEKLGKNKFPCDMKSLDERWRVSSHPNCNPYSTTKKAKSNKGGWQKMSG